MSLTLETSLIKDVTVTHRLKAVMNCVIGESQQPRQLILNPFALARVP